MEARWEWGNRGGVAVGLLAAAAGVYAKDVFALLAFGAAGALFFAVVYRWPANSGRQIRSRRLSLAAVVIVTVVLASYSTAGLVGLRRGEEPLSETVKSAVRDVLKREQPPAVAARLRR